MNVELRVEIIQTGDRQQVVGAGIDPDILDTHLRQPLLGQRITDFEILQTQVAGILQPMLRVGICRRARIAVFAGDPLRGGIVGIGRRIGRMPAVHVFRNGVGTRPERLLQKLASDDVTVCPTPARASRSRFLSTMR